MLLFLGWFTAVRDFKKNLFLLVYCCYPNNSYTSDVFKLFFS
jgi:hypothetical protein